jgi:hypothetical protein
MGCSGLRGASQPATRRVTVSLGDCAASSPSGEGFFGPGGWMEVMAGPVSGIRYPPGRLTERGPLHCPLRAPGIRRDRVCSRISTAIDCRMACQSRPFKSRPSQFVALTSGPLMPRPPLGDMPRLAVPTTLPSAQQNPAAVTHVRQDLCLLRCDSQCERHKCGSGELSVGCAGTRRSMLEICSEQVRMMQSRSKSCTRKWNVLGRCSHASRCFHGGAGIGFTNAGCPRDFLWRRHLRIPTRPWAEPPPNPR